MKERSDKQIESIWSKFNDILSTTTFPVGSKLFRLGFNIINVPKVLYFGPEKCLKEFISRVRLASKRQVWSTFFLFEIFDHVSKGKFGPHSNCSKRQFWSRFGGKSGPKLPFLNNLSHVWEMF